MTRLAMVGRVWSALGFQQDAFRPTDMRATLHAIRRDGGDFYTHGYPVGTWKPFPRIQVYQNKSAASRQANALKKHGWNGKGIEVVEVHIEVVEP